MEIYLDHPYHGAQVVHTHAEAAEMEKRGWKRRQHPEDAVKAKRAALAAERAAEAAVEPEPAPTRKYTRSGQ